MNDNLKELPTEKPLVQYNEKGFVLNYSVTRNEEVAFIDYENDTITFKQMPLPLERIKEMLSHYDSNKKDHESFLAEENRKNENNKSEGSK